MDDRTLNYLTIAVAALAVGGLIGLYVGWNAGWSMAVDVHPQGLRGVYFNETAYQHCDMNVTDRVAEIRCSPESFNTTSEAAK